MAADPFKAADADLGSAAPLTLVPTDLAVGEEVLQRTGSQAAAIRWHDWRKELSIGLELECFLPDLGALVADQLAPLETKADLLKLVAESLTQQLEKLSDECLPTGDMPRCKADHRISADEKDWGRLWTVTDDMSIKPELSRGNANPFPVEVVSKRMRFVDGDVAQFCDVVHTLSLPPISAKANESTGLHVHIGKYPNFFSVDEVVCILKAYLRFEPVINRLLPITRRRNKFCQDLREHLAKQAGLGSCASEEEILRFVDRALFNIKSLTAEKRELVIAGVQGATTKMKLLPDLLGSGLVWSAKRPLTLTLTAEGREEWIPAGMELKELLYKGQHIWKAPGSQDLLAVWEQDKEPPNPWDALELLNEEAEIVCSFAMPQEVQLDRMDFWLLQNHLGLGRREQRYVKLNLTRIHLPSDRATLEFRGFPGGNFTKSLTIWGWVKFLGLFISQCLSVPLNAIDCSVPADEAELKRFMHISQDTLLVAWYRDMLIQQPATATLMAKMRAQWEELCKEWHETVAQAGDDKQLLTACGCWRRVFWTAGGMRNLFPPDDDIWANFQTIQKAAGRFMQRLYQGLEERLKDYTMHLSAVEEVSRCTSLPTAVRICINDGEVVKKREDIRLLQVTIMETGGWSQCRAEMLQSIGEHGALSAELLLDHMKNLLCLCERSTATIRGEAASESNTIPWPPEQGSTWTGADHYQGNMSTAMVSLRDSKGAGALNQWSLVLSVYAELCHLLAPRADEAQVLWKGLRGRGWDPDRVIALNKCLRTAQGFMDMD